MPVPCSIASWCLVCALAGVAGFAAHAQPASPRSPAATVDGRTWASLTPAQQKALRPLQAEWGSIDATRRAKWVDLANRLPTMPPEERERVQTRMNDWARMTPTERGQARLNYRQAQRLPAEDRKARWEAYKALPPEQQQQLAERARPGASAERRRTRRDEAPAKSTLVPTPAARARPAAVAPSLAQGGPGATTTLVTKRPSPPAHQQPGLPKVPTGSTFVDSRTLLPKRGAQAAATRPATGASSPLVLPRP